MVAIVYGLVVWAVLVGVLVVFMVGADRRK